MKKVSKFVLVFVAIGFVFSFSIAMATPFPNPSQFQTAKPVPGLGFGDYMGSVTPDGKSMIFQRGAPHQLYSAEWDGNIWTNITHIDVGVGGYNGWPTLTLDGERLFFGSSGYVYQSHHEQSGWSQAQLIPLDFGTYGNGGPFFDSMTSTLYFCKAVGYHLYDLWSVPYDPEQNILLGSPSPLPYPFNTDATTDIDARIFDNGRVFLWASGLDGVGPRDIWMSTRESINDPWSTPIQMGDAVDGVLTSEYNPWYSAATGTLYFGRDNMIYQSVPEPATLLLLGLGSLTLLRKRRL